MTNTLEIHLRNLNKYQYTKFDNTISICEYELLDSKAALQKNYISFSDNYIQKYYDIKYHLVWYFEGFIYANPINENLLSKSIEYYSIDVQDKYKELLKQNFNKLPFVEMEKENLLKFFEHTKKKSLESFDSKINTRMAETFVPTFSPDIKVLDMNPKVIQFQIVNIGPNTYRYLLLSNGDIIKEKHTSYGNFEK